MNVSPAFIPRVHSFCGGLVVIVITYCFVDTPDPKAKIYIQVVPGVEFEEL